MREVLPLVACKWFLNIFVDALSFGSLLTVWDMLFTLPSAHATPEDEAASAPASAPADTATAAEAAAAPAAEAAPAAVSEPAPAVLEVSVEPSDALLRVSLALLYQHQEAL